MLSEYCSVIYLVYIVKLRATCHLVKLLHIIQTKCDYANCLGYQMYQTTTKYYQVLPSGTTIT